MGTEENTPPLLDYGFNEVECQIVRSLQDLQQMINQVQIDRGWIKRNEDGEFEGPSFDRLINLMHSEISESVEADRTGAMDKHLPDVEGRFAEFADVVIRAFGTAAIYKQDLATIVMRKHRYNMTRKDHDPKTRAKQY